MYLKLKWLINVSLTVYESALQSSFKNLLSAIFLSRRIPLSDIFLIPVTHSVSGQCFGNKHCIMIWLRIEFIGCCYSITAIIYYEVLVFGPRDVHEMSTRCVRDVLLKPPGTIKQNRSIEKCHLLAAWKHQHPKPNAKLRPTGTFKVKGRCCNKHLHHEKQMRIRPITAKQRRDTSTKTRAAATQTNERWPNLAKSNE